MFTHSPLGHALEKQTETTEDQGEKQIKAIKSRFEKQLSDIDKKLITSFFSKEFLTEEAKYELSKIAAIEQKYETGI